MASSKESSQYLSRLEEEYFYRHIEVEEIAEKSLEKIELQKDPLFYNSFYLLINHLHETNGNPIMTTDLHYHIANAIQHIPYMIIKSEVATMYRRILDATDPETRSKSIIPLDVGQTLDPTPANTTDDMPIISLLATQEEALRHAIDSVDHDKSIQFVLDGLGGESSFYPHLTPDIARKIAKPVFDHEGNRTYRLPTDVGGVEIDYSYGDIYRFPLVSVVVSPLRL